MMKNTNFRLPLRILSVALGALAGLTFVTAAYTRDTQHPGQFVCPGGERFSVEFKGTHVRLRTGSGIFSLAPAEDQGGRYSDGNLAFRLDGDKATLERTGLPPLHGCMAEQSSGDRASRL
jgi:hypothetical protein